MTGVESNYGALSGVLIFNILAALPLWRVYRRCGLPGWWSLIAFVPLVGFPAVVGVLCHARWPDLPDRRPTRPAIKARREAGAARKPTE